MNMIMASIQSSKDLPQDLATAILVRLPAKSLVRLRCVHTSWNALFRTRTFVMDHYPYSSQREHLMIFDTHNIYDFCEHYDVPVVIHNDDPAQPPHHHHYHVPLSPLARQDKELRQMLPYSSCNGIFLMCGIYTDDTYQLMLWNPGTREVKVVPPPPHCHPPPADSVFSYLNWDDMLYKPTFGFGVDRETNDYKIVSLSLNRFGVTLKVYMYSLSTDSWATTIHEDVPLVALFHSFRLIGSTHANGVCHWFCGSNHSDYYKESGILYFDLSNNRFKLIKLPVYNFNVYYQWEECCGYERSFLVNDFIAYVACYPDLNKQENKNYRLGVWVFDKVDDDEGGWTRTHDMELFNVELRVYGFWKATGEFLATAHFKEYLVSLGYDGQPMREIQYDSND